MIELELIEELSKRRDEIRAWLREEAPETSMRQAHLDVDASERAYWTHGYQSALDDVLSLLILPQGAGSMGRSTH